MDEHLRQMPSMGLPFICMEEVTFLVEPELEALTKFATLTKITQQVLAEAMSARDVGNAKLLFSLDPQRMLGFLRQEQTCIPATLTRWWEEWQEQHRGMLLRQPRLELFYALRSLGIGSSLFGGKRLLPEGYEWRVLDWVDSGHHHPLPVPEETEVMTQRFYERLVALRRECRGWICRAEYGKVMLKFVPDTGLAKLRAEHMHAEYEGVLRQQGNQNRNAFRYMPEETAAIQRLNELALETYEVATREYERLGGGSAINPTVAIDPSNPEVAYKKLSGHSDEAKALLPKWKAWEAHYSELLTRHPLQELHHLLKQISPARPWVVLRWIESGQFRPTPLDGRHEVSPELRERFRVLRQLHDERRHRITPEFYERLWTLRQQLGGWLVGANFVPDIELPAVIAKLRSEKREHFLKWQAGILSEGLRFAPGEGQAAHRFEQLAVDTYDLLDSLELEPSEWGFDIDPATVISLLEREGAAIPASMIERWKAWRAEYSALMERHPRQLLYTMVYQIERTSKASWPSEFDAWKVLDWVESNQMQPIPFGDRSYIITPEFYARLRSIVERTGEWPIEGSGGIAFVPRDEWEEPRKRAAATRVQSEGNPTLWNWIGKS